MEKLKTKVIMDYKRFLSIRSARRKPSPIRELQPLVSLPGMISLGGGMPNTSLFPFQKIGLTTKDGKFMELFGESLDKALQYSPSYGLPELVSWIKQLQKEEHKMEVDYDWDVCVTTGSQDAMSKAFDMLCNDGDYIITENPTYSGAIAAMNPIGLKLIGVDCDQNGMDVDQLETILAQWQFKVRPLRVIYTIPTGQNPSGATLSLERRKKLYALACKYNLIIIEDDPYYFLQLPQYNSQSSEVEPIQSLLSMDVEGRVLRFDSFSKIMSSGMRMGFVTGPKFFVERIQLDQQASALHASGISQIMLYSVLKDWGRDGFVKHVKNVQKFYTERRDCIVSSVEKHLKGLVEYYPPSAGMFLWMKLKGVQDSSDLIKKKAIDEKFLMVPGQAFTPGDAKSPYVRAAFSTATPYEIEEAIKRLGNLLKQ